MPYSAHIRKVSFLRSFLRINTETYNWTILRECETLEYSVLQQTPPIRLRDLRDSGKIRSAIGSRSPPKDSVSSRYKNNSHMNS